MPMLSWGALTRRQKQGTGAGAAAAVALAIGIIAPWEGLRTTAYQDIVGVWTVCYGETKGVQRGDTHTPEECKTMLAREVASYEANLRARCLDYPMPDAVRAAVVSLAYNIGVQGVCSGSIARLAAANDLRGICNILPRYNRAGGKVVRGLANRRLAEQKICLAALQ